MEELSLPTEQILNDDHIVDVANSMDLYTLCITQINQIIGDQYNFL